MGTFDKIKEGFKKTADKVEDTAKDVVDPDTYTGSDNQKNSDYQAGGKEPMNPEEIAEHEPTAVKRDKNQETSGDAV